MEFSDLYRSQYIDRYIDVYYTIAIADTDRVNFDLANSIRT